MNLVDSVSVCFFHMYFACVFYVCCMHVVCVMCMCNICELYICCMSLQRVSSRNFCLLIYFSLLLRADLGPVPQYPISANPGLS